jgi:hypothetical protein
MLPMYQRLDILVSLRHCPLLRSWTIAGGGLSVESLRPAMSGFSVWEKEGDSSWNHIQEPSRVYGLLEAS